MKALKLGGLEARRLEGYKAGKHKSLEAWRQGGLKALKLRSWELNEIGTED